MRHLVSKVHPISGRHVVKRYSGFGNKGADIPTGGDNGGSPVLNDGISATSEYYWRLETPPGSGTVTIFPDLSYLFSGAADGTWPWVYRLYWVDADGTMGNGTATVTDIFGSGAVALVIAKATHGHAADGVTLTTQWLLSVADALHANFADSLGLSSTGSASLSVSDGAHGHLADAVTLATRWVLSIAEALHAHAAENEVLDTSNAAWLTLQEAVHSHAADNLGLSTQAWLAVAEAVHAHFADSTVLSIPAVGGGGPISDDDIERIVVAVLAALQATRLPVNVVEVLAHPVAGEWPTAIENADALLSRNWP